MSFSFFHLFPPYHCSQCYRLVSWKLCVVFGFISKDRRDAASHRALLAIRVCVRCSKYMHCAFNHIYENNSTYGGRQVNGPHPALALERSRCMPCSRRAAYGCRCLILHCKCTMTNRCWKWLNFFVANIARYRWTHCDPLWGTAPSREKKKNFHRKEFEVKSSRSVRSRHKWIFIS